MKGTCLLAVGLALGLLASLTVAAGRPPAAAADRPDGECGISEPFHGQYGEVSMMGDPNDPDCGPSGPQVSQAAHDALGDAEAAAGTSDGSGVSAPAKSEPVVAAATQKPEPADANGPMKAESVGTWAKNNADGSPPTPSATHPDGASTAAEGSVGGAARKSATASVLPETGGPNFGFVLLGAALLAGTALAAVRCLSH